MAKMIRIPGFEITMADTKRGIFVELSDLLVLVYETANANRADFPAVAQAFEMFASSLKSGAAGE